MIRVERTVRETYVVPVAQLRKRLGLGEGALYVEVPKPNKERELHAMSQWDEDWRARPGEKMVVKFQVVRHETETRPNRGKR